MQKISSKRILLYSAILILLIVATVANRGHFPLSRIFKNSGAPEHVFINNQQIKTEAPHSLFFDFESDPKGGNRGSFYNGIAHSGHYSTKAFGKNSYTYSIERTAGEIGPDNLAALSVSAWIYVFPGKDEPQGNLVFYSSNEKIQTAWKAVTVKGKEVPRGKWFKISGTFDLSDIAFKPDYKLVFYFWNDSNTDILMDDLYIVFGGPKPRKGDSTLVNLAGGAVFTPKFNCPPYPFHQLMKQETGNNNSSFLINQNNSKEGNLSPYDRIFSGHFISANQAPDDILVITASGKPELYSWCNEQRVFRKTDPQIPMELISRFQSEHIITGRYSNDGKTQIILSDHKGLLVGEFENLKNICQGVPQKVRFTSLLNTTENNLYDGAAKIISADLDGNGIKEILSVSPSGSWTISRFEKGSGPRFTVIASGKGESFMKWDARKYITSIAAGRFLARYSSDVILNISKEKSKPGCSWTIIRYDGSRRNLVACYSEKQYQSGKTIGLDTLKPTDEIFTGIFDDSGTEKVFRYNRDWRYDLKEIMFNDTTFAVIANIDFTGYEGDHNPKYFEMLKLVPGCFINPRISSFLTIGKNCKDNESGSKECGEFTDQPFLPGETGVYNYPKTEKK